MEKTDRRILEIIYHNMYMWYIMNNTTHTHVEFVSLPHLLQTTEDYDAELLEREWLQYLEENPTPPTLAECALAMTKASPLIVGNPSMFKPFYNVKYINTASKRILFRKHSVTLVPKISNEKFHTDLLAYFKQIKLITKGFRSIKNGI